MFYEHVGSVYISLSLAAQKEEEFPNQRIIVGLRNLSKISNIRRFLLVDDDFISSVSSLSWGISDALAQLFAFHLV